MERRSRRWWFQFIRGLIEKYTIYMYLREHVILLVHKASGYKILRIYFL